MSFLKLIIDLKLRFKNVGEPKLLQKRVSGKQVRVTAISLSNSLSHPLSLTHTVRFTGVDLAGGVWV